MWILKFNMYFLGCTSNRFKCDKNPACLLGAQNFTCPQPNTIPAPSVMVDGCSQAQPSNTCVADPFCSNSVTACEDNYKMVDASPNPGI